MTDVLILGGGAAGLMAAGAACAKGLRVTVVEHHPSGGGQKLLITGKGRCNVTSDSDVREFLPFVRHNGRFLYSSLYAFPPSAAGSVHAVGSGRPVCGEGLRTGRIRSDLLCLPTHGEALYCFSWF